MSELVIVDTDVWSEAFRKVGGDASAELRFLREIVADDRVQMLGCIRQEVLQGMKRAEVFERVREQLRAFPERATKLEEYELAAEFFNTCRSKGIQGSNTDFLICACSVTWGLPILTKDKDFGLYAQYLPLKLVQV